MMRHSEEEQNEKLSERTMFVTAMTEKKVARIKDASAASNRARKAVRACACESENESGQGHRKQ
jgi:predicted esterase